MDIEGQPEETSGIRGIGAEQFESPAEQNPHETEPSADINQWLKCDTLHPVNTPNFDGMTGEDIRDNPERQAEVLRRKRLITAENDIRNVLGYKSDARYSGFTGTKLPPFAIDEQGYGRSFASRENT